MQIGLLNYRQLSRRGMKDCTGQRSTKGHLWLFGTLKTYNVILIHTLLVLCYKNTQRIFIIQVNLFLRDEQNWNQQDSEPLFPRMKQSPYSFISKPSTHSTVFSSAIFMKPSKQAIVPSVRPKTLNLPVSPKPSNLEVSRLEPTNLLVSSKDQCTSVFNPAIQFHDYILSYRMSCNNPTYDILQKLAWFFAAHFLLCVQRIKPTPSTH